MDKELRTLIELLLNSAFDDAASEDLTVVSKHRIEKLEAYLISHTSV